MQAMFSKIGLAEVSQAFQHLATLRPAIIIPQIVERFVTLTSTQVQLNNKQCFPGLSLNLM